MKLKASYLSWLRQRLQGKRLLLPGQGRHLFIEARYDNLSKGMGLFNGPFLIIKAAQDFNRTHMRVEHEYQRAE